MGLNVEELSPHKIKASNAAYIHSMCAKMLDKPLSDYPKYSTPADATQLREAYEEAKGRRDRGEKCDESLCGSYGSKVGSLIYCSPGTRVDCAYVISMCARCLTFPTVKMDACATRVLVYLGQHADEGLPFDGNTPDAGCLEGWADSDWACGHGTNASVCKLAGAAIGHSSRRQVCISMSSTESEIMAASECALELVYFRRLLREMGLPQMKPTVLNVDNQGAVELSKHQKSCHRSRHVLRRFFKVRELVAIGEITVKWCPTDDNVADLLTKALEPAKFNKFKNSAMNQPKAATIGDSPGEVMLAWATVLGVDPSIETYAQYCATADSANACIDCDSSEPDFVNMCAAVGLGGAMAEKDDSGRRFESNNKTHDALATFAGQVQMAGSSTLNPLHHGLFETGFDGQWCAFASMDADDDPSYNKAINGGDQHKWEDAMESEMNNLKRFEAFLPVSEDSLPGWNGRFAPECTECIWVLKRKRGKDNQITKYKARCVYNDRRRLCRDVIETFSPAVRHTTVKAALAVSCVLKRTRFAFDVTGAYLQGKFAENEVVYARPPMGQRKVDTRGVPIVWKMNVPLYGQGDAGLIWYRTLRNQLIGKQGFNGSDCDPSYFWKRY